MLMLNKFAKIQGIIRLFLSGRDHKLKGNFNKGEFFNEFLTKFLHPCCTGTYILLHVSSHVYPRVYCISILNRISVDIITVASAAILARTPSRSTLNSLFLCSSQTSNTPALIPTPVCQ